MPKYAEGLPEKPFTRGDFITVQGIIDKYGEDENPIVSIRLIKFDLVELEILSSEENIYLESDQEITYNKLKKMIDIINNNKGKSKVYLDYYDRDNKALVRLQFKDCVNKKSEQVLKKILEV